MWHRECGADGSSGLAHAAAQGMGRASVPYTRQVLPRYFLSWMLPVITIEDIKLGNRSMCPNMPPLSFLKE